MDTRCALNAREADAQILRDLRSRHPRGAMLPPFVPTVAITRGA